MKSPKDIVKWGKPKVFFDNNYKFNSLDLETIDNELFLIGVIHKDVYDYTLGNFYEYLNDFFITCVKNNCDIVTWSRYDNTFIIKELLRQFNDNDQLNYLKRVDKVTPIFSYEYKSYNIEITNIIKNNVIITIRDKDDRKKRVTLYNIKNLYQTDLSDTAKNYKLAYSKLGEEYHIIDRKRFNNDVNYRSLVIHANYLDNKVAIDIANNLLKDYQTLTGVLPKTLFTAGSLARSYLMTIKNTNFNYRSVYKEHRYFDDLLLYAMRSYHGGKIESYILGYIKEAKIIDITSAYPYALSKLPKLTRQVIYDNDVNLLKKYFYAFINCTITIKDPNFIHPITVAIPMNSTNISPYGTFKSTITKVEYDYLIANNIDVQVHDYFAIKHENVYPYKKIIDKLFDDRIINKVNNPSLSELDKVILNSLYGIMYELTDVYEEEDNNITYKGYRAGDFFNPILASYITAITRTYLSHVSYHIVKNGGQVYLNMTDSIMYNGNINLPIFSGKKKLGAFDNPTTIKDLVILGAGRYEYFDDFKKEYVIKSRGFNVKRKDKKFYGDLDLIDTVLLKTKNFVTFFKATTEKHGFNKLGHLIEEEYKINPFNLGGKRIVDNDKIDLNCEYTVTRPLKVDLTVDLSPDL